MMGLLGYLNSDYVRAANRLNGGRRRVVAYVEGYDDIAFWRQILQQFESEKLYFEVMLPSRTSLAKGKKMALTNQLGPEMIACVDADYDLILSHISPAQACKDFIKNQAYILHTYVYAIENLQCHSVCLHDVCVKASLNDKRIFSFSDFLRAYSEAIWPLFLWSVWAYGSHNYKEFSLTDFAETVTSAHINFSSSDKFINKVKARVQSVIIVLQKRFPYAVESLPGISSALQSLGITPQNTYLYMRGHDLMDRVVLPLIESVNKYLRREREHEISCLAQHSRQEQNELSAYRKACGNLTDILRRQNSYTSTKEYQRILLDAEQLFAGDR